MKKLNSADKNYIPTILIDEEIGLIELSGNSMMENPQNFYNEFLDLITDLLKSNQQIDVNVRMEHINTLSSKWLYYTFKFIEKLYVPGENTININWLFKDSDDVMEEIGDDYQHVVRIPFNLVPLAA